MTTLEQFPVIDTLLSLRGKAVEGARQKWIPILEELENAMRAGASEGDKKSLTRHQDRGQILRVLDLILAMTTNEALMLSGSARQDCAFARSRFPVSRARTSLGLRARRFECLC